MFDKVAIKLHGPGVKTFEKDSKGESSIIEFIQNKYYYLIIYLILFIIIIFYFIIKNTISYLNKI